MTTVGALDIGGTHVTAGRVDVERAVVDPGSRVRVAFPPAGGPALLERIVEAAAGVATSELSRFGVATPGPFDYAAGICLISHKLPGLYGVDLGRELATTLDLTERQAVVFLNDAEAFLLGEWWAGAARGHARAVGITLGTGLGSAFLEDGRIVRSDERVPSDGELYTLEFRGAPVEETISRGALLAGYGEEGLDVEAIAARAREGESRARLVFRNLGAELAEFLQPELEAFAPTCLVVGGSIAHAWDLLEPGLAGLQQVVVGRAARIDDAPLLGAAWHASRELDGAEQSS
jgi:glucokinase